MAISVTRLAPLSAPSGVTAVADHGFEKIYNEESGSLVDRTTEFTNGTSLPTAFAADDDYIYFGVPVLFRNGTSSTTASNRDCRFVDIHIDLETVASATISPVFQYSNGDNSWATLSVTDGTNGFTQSGTITFNRSSLPTATAWLVATKDGAGNTIGDGVARGYVRIKRTANTLTTPPVIRTVGTGILTASTTYYYKVCHMSAGAISTSSVNYLRSALSSEVSATTTTTARSVKISWTNNANASCQMVWRTPISGDYAVNYTQKNYEKLYSSSTKQCDLAVQQVKGVYFNYLSGLTRYQDFIIDNGVPTNATYSATWLLSADYMDHLPRPYEQGEITVSGGTSGTPATFKDILAADIAGSWNAFKIVNYPTSFNRYYTCTDTLILKDYVTESNCTLDMDASIHTHSNYNSVFVFGAYPTADSDFYTKGVTFIQTGETSSNKYIYLYNTTLYNCSFKDNCIEVGNNRTYCVLQIRTNSKIYDVDVQAQNQFENFTITNTSVVVDGLSISNARYGLYIPPPTGMSLSNITLNGTSGIYLDPFTNGSYTFNNFNFKGVTKPLYNTYATPKNDQEINLVDCAFYACDPENSVIGALSSVYRKWTIGLTILDKNGDPIENADVSIKDGTETISYSLQTDSNGQISQATTVGKYLPGTVFNATYNSRYADVITLYDNFTIEVSKAGYQTYTLPAMTIDEPKSLILKLKPQKKVATDDMGEVYINIDPKDEKDTLNIIKV